MVWQRGSKAKIMLPALVMVTSALAGPSGYVSFATLIQQADSIVIGDITAQSDTGSEVVLDVLVIRVLKGNVGPGATVVAKWQPSAVTSRVAFPNLGPSRGMLFLRSVGNALTVLPILTSPVRPTDLYVSMPSGELPAAYAYTSNAAVEDKITAELSARVEAMKGSSLSDGAFYLEAVDSMTAASALTVYQRLAGEGLRDVQVIGIAGLIRKGDITSLGQPGTSVTLAASPQWPLVINNICSHYRNTSVGGVAILSTLSGTGQGMPAVQQCATHALSAIHTKEALGTLYQLLDSKDGLVRYDAVLGMASFANNLPVQTIDNTAGLGFLKAAADGPFTTSETKASMPSLPAFRSNEQKYLQFWRQWWVQVQGRL